MTAMKVTFKSQVTVADRHIERGAPRTHHLL